MTPDLKIIGHQNISDEDNVNEDLSKFTITDTSTKLIREDTEESTKPTNPDKLTI